MPILRKESEIFPPELFDLPVTVAPWEIAHVRSRQEKTLARLLHQEEKPFYLPQIEHTVRRNGRKLTSHLPLFPGYVFFRRVDGVRDVLWRTNVIANLIEVPDQLQLHEELQQLRDLQQQGASLIPESKLVPGDTVRVSAGAFKGYRGMVVEERGGGRLIVLVSILKKAVSVEFPRTALATLPAHETVNASHESRR